MSRSLARVRLRDMSGSAEALDLGAVGAHVVGDHPLRGEALLRIAPTLHRIETVGRRERAMAALLVAHPAQEEEVVAGMGLDRVELEVERVRAVSDPREVRLRGALVHRDRDEAGVRRDAADLLVELAGLAVERTMDGVDDGGGDGLAEHGPDRPRVVVDHLEVPGALVTPQRVPELPEA